jgi:hypothetical protein
MSVPGMAAIRKFDTPRHYIHSNARDNPGYAGCMMETEVRMILRSKPTTTTTTTNNNNNNNNILFYKTNYKIGFYTCK